MIGQVIGSYQVIRKLGEGGMGAVYEATHTTLARRAAVKVLHAEISKKPDIVARFINEAKATNIIGHPDIVDIFELGTLPSGEVFILMEFLDGESLGQRLKRLGRLEVHEALRIAARVATALAAAHHKGIVHRDLKPDNVMLLPDRRGGREVSIKLLDFGIAKLAAEHAGPGGGLHTGTGVMMGTPAYMSPEQCRGAGGVDDRTDVYALGIMLFEMLQGRPPFTGAGVGDLIVMHLTTPPPPMRGVPAEVNALVGRMLAKTAAERPGMVAVAQELARLAEQPLTAQPTPTPRQPLPLVPPQKTPTMERQSYAAGALERPPKPQRPLWLAGVGAGVLLVGGIAGAKLWLSPTQEPPGQAVVGRVDPDGAAVKMLADIDGDLLARRWSDAARRADELLQRTDVSAARHEVATAKKERAESEKRSQDIYERFSEAGGAGKYDDALKVYRTLAADSVYRQVAKEEYDKLFPLFVSNHLQKADAARRSGDCTTAQAEVDQVLAVEPRHLQALTAKDQPCGKSGTRPPRPAPPERPEVADAKPAEPPRRGDLRNPFTKPVKSSNKPDKTAKPQDESTASAASQADIDQETADQKILSEASAAHINGDFERAIELARPLGKYTRAWRIMGAIACQKKDMRQTTEAYRRLDASGKQYLQYVCLRYGVIREGSTFRLAD